MRLFLAAAALLGVAAALPAQEHNPVHWKAASAGVTAKAGARISVPVSAEIESGWHLYSLKKLEEGPIPTSLAVAAGQPFRLDGKIESPEPVSMDDPNFGMTVEYYLGTVQFVLPVRVDAAAAPGPHVLRITVRYQSCSEKLCLPPKNVTVEARVTVAK